MTVEADVAKVRAFIEHEREMRECCTDLPDYMCAPIHAEAALDRIEAAYRKTRAERDGLKDELAPTQRALGLFSENADLRRQLDAAKSGDADLRQELAEIGHRILPPLTRPTARR